MFYFRILLLSCLIAFLSIWLTGCEGIGAADPVKSAPEKAQNEKNHLPGEAVNNNQNTAAKNQSQPLLLTDFLPDREMTKVFRGGFENSGMVHVVDKVADRKVQIKLIHFGGPIAKVYRVTDEAIFLVHVETENLAGDFTSKPDNRNEIVIKSPIQTGTSWEEHGLTYTITQADVQISTPAGVFRAIEVTAQNDEYTMTRYFAHGVGVIKASARGFGYELVGIYYNTVDEKYLDRPSQLMAKYADYFDN